MSFTPVDPNKIAGLLNKPTVTLRRRRLDGTYPDEDTAAPVREQHGPLRWYDTTMRCVHTETHGTRHYNCNSPTYCKVNGIPKCHVHALKELNEMLVEKGGES